MKVLVEMTDTFGGEPNYCWLQRHTLEMPDDLHPTAVVRRAKRALSMQHVRCRREYDGTTITLRPYACARVIFITYPV